MRLLIAGIDGYLGWALSHHLAARGHQVIGIDAGLRRSWVAEMGAHSAIPVAEPQERRAAFAAIHGTGQADWAGDLTDYPTVDRLLREHRPDAIVHLGEMPSAPYSMLDVQHATWTQHNNLIGTLNLLFAMRDHAPKCHMVKLGTMGEYGTPNVVIPEGFFEIEYRGRKDRLPFPRQAGSWYHQTKVHDSNNIMLACKIWGLRSTDLMQGVVYGTRWDNMADDPRLRTRLDFDQCFGTAINRFCCQAVIGHPLTPYGKGRQKRGFIPLRDSLQCMTIAIENPPAKGEYRVFNQFEEVYDVTELAQKVQAAGRDFGLKVEIRNTENPRMEAEDHFYQPDHEGLLKLGYKPTRDMDRELRYMLEDLILHKDRILAKQDVLMPDIRWGGERRRVGYLDSK